MTIFELIAGTVFSAAGVTAIATIAVTIAPQRHRIVRVLAGRSTRPTRPALRAVPRLVRQSGR